MCRGEKKMKTEMIQTESRKEAVNQAPWAAKIVKVDGGYMAFESVADYKIWKNQK
jgi:hypothetical protein